MKPSGIVPKAACPRRTSTPVTRISFGATRQIAKTFMARILFARWSAFLLAAILGAVPVATSKASDERTELVIIVPNTTTSYFKDLTDGASLEAKELGYSATVEADGPWPPLPRGKIPRRL